MDVGATLAEVATDARRAAAGEAAAEEDEEPYYWEEGGDRAPDVVKRVGHNLHWASLQLFSGVEYVGELFAELFGMTSSRYEWALEAARQQEVRSCGCGGRWNTTACIQQTMSHTPTRVRRRRQRRRSARQSSRSGGR